VFQPGGVNHGRIISEDDLFGYRVIARCIVSRRAELPKRFWGKWIEIYGTEPPIPMNMTLSGTTATFGDVTCKLTKIDSAQGEDAVAVAWRCPNETEDEHEKFPSDKGKALSSRGCKRPKCAFRLSAAVSSDRPAAVWVAASTRSCRCS
jgi:hypothetical protein